MITYDVSQEPLVINKVTIDVIMKNCEHVGECLALYAFFYYTAKWQGTNRAKAAVSYCAKGLGFSVPTIRRAKKELITCGLIEDYRHLDEKTRKVLGWYVKVNFVQFTHPSDFPQGGMEENHPSDFPQGGNISTNALSTNSLNALTTNKGVAVPSREGKPQQQEQEAKRAATKQQRIVREKDFETFWECWPKKKSKAAALRMWMKSKDLPDISEVIKSVESSKLSKDWTKDNGQYIPHASTWIYNSRWNDEIENSKGDFVMTAKNGNGEALCNGRTLREHDEHFGIKR